MIDKYNMDNKIYLSPDSSILLDDLKCNPIRQKSLEKPKLNAIKVP